MTGTLADTAHELTDIQRKAVEWSDGPLLVLAGPGSGKTHVLTCRVAQLLDTSPNERFRVLGLTFTNKAAHEMKTRIAALVPGNEERAEINTFHGFCAQLLRQHGTHLGIRPNFEIYSRTADREALLEDALRRQSKCFGRGDLRLLPRIDALKAHLISPEQAAQYLEKQDILPNEPERIADVYRLYEEELRRSNALDLNSLIFLSYQLMNYSAIARHCRASYRYWLIDEFQDTNGPQYDLLRRMAGDNFQQLFAVADDDQTIYEWNGANVKHISRFVEDFKCEIIQLTDNFRCPTGIVEAANRLVVYNVRRDFSKQSAKAARLSSNHSEWDIQCQVFSSDAKEAAGIATEIADLKVAERHQTAVLARNRTLLEAVRVELLRLNVPVILLARKDEFASPQMRWMVAYLKQINRPLDGRNMSILVETFGRFTGITTIDTEDLTARSKTNQVTLLTAWMDAVREESPSSTVLQAMDVLASLTTDNVHFADAVKQVIQYFGSADLDGDLQDDISAWCRIERDIRQARGTVSLDQFLQELALRSKEPIPQQGSVSLSTIHGAKGLEFDRVYLIGLAEEVLPSWHSVRKAIGSAALEEERRGCFVAITRTKRYLILSRANSYRGRPKNPSRFLNEMGLLTEEALRTPVP